MCCQPPQLRNIYIYIYMPETRPGGYLLRLQDVEKQRERRETKANKGTNKKEEKTGKQEKTHKFVGVLLGHFYYRTGEK